MLNFLCAIRLSVDRSFTGMVGYLCTFMCPHGYAALRNTPHQQASLRRSLMSCEVLREKLHELKRGWFARAECCGYMRCVNVISEFSYSGQFVWRVKPRLHDTTCCQTGLTNGYIVYTAGCETGCTTFLTTGCLYNRLSRKVMKAVLCCCVRQLCTMIRIHILAVLEVEHWFRFSFSFCVCLGLEFYVFFSVLALFFCSCDVCFCCVGFSFFSTSQEIGWEERLWNDRFCVEWDVKP